MRRSQAALAAALTVLLAVQGAVIYLDDAPKEFAPEQALEQFREQDAAAASAPAAVPAPSATGPTAAAPQPPRPGAAPADPPGAATPAARPRASGAPAAGGEAEGEDVEPGVYTYATRGYEEVDALGGARHDYPARSAVSYRRGSCGTIDEWQPLQGRVSTNTVCRGRDGHEPRRSTQRREFFGQSETQDLICDPGLVLIPYRAKVGSTSTGRCRSSDSEVRLTVRVLESGTRVVAGERTAAVRVRIDGRLTGKTRGTTFRDEWFTPGGLLLSAVGTTDSDRDTTGGTVHYSERFELSVESLRPQR